MPKTLLLADDSVTIQRVIELTFADEDVTVIAVGDGDAAIARLESEPPDIVLADVGMPGRSGYDVAMHVRRHPGLAHVPVVLLAGALEPLDENLVRECGCAGVLVKPFEPQMVIARVRELLSGRTAAFPALADTTDRQSPGDALMDLPIAASDAPSVDDYFDRLDAAFASLHGTPAPARPSVPGPAAATPGPIGPMAPMPVPAPSTATSPVAAAADATAPAPVAVQAPAPLSMVDAFGALLGVEQGEPPPLLPDSWQPVLHEGLVEQVAQRVTEQISERLIREIAPDIVSRVAERLVREEIERLKALPRAR